MDTEDIATNAIREMILTSEHHQYRLPREETLRTRRQTHETEKSTADGALRLSRSAVKEDNCCVQELTGKYIPQARDEVGRQPQLVLVVRQRKVSPPQMVG